MDFVDLVKRFIDSDPGNVQRLADDCHIALSTVNRWAKGKNLPHAALRPAIIAYIESQSPRKA